MSALDVPFEPPPVEIGLVWGEIDAFGVEGARWPVDAVAVGHYLGVTPHGAELALDRAISSHLFRRNGRRAARPLLLTQLAQRGVIRGDFGQPFFVRDPRPSGRGGAADRVVAVAGMGPPGRFGEAELTVLARELCWSLGLMGKKHLATVLIGAGEGNLPVGEAVHAWVRGVKHALSGAVEGEGTHVRRLTFVERDPQRVVAIRAAVLAEKAELARTNRLRVHYRGPSAEDLGSPQFEKERRRFERVEWERWRERRERPESEVATRVTIEVGGGRYRFGAITATASVPQREVELDPALVMRANDELAAESDPAMQLERARFLEELLVPDDLRATLYTPAPLVMLLDPTTARIHWELLAPPDTAPAAASPEHARGPGGGDGTDGDADGAPHFLGTSRGFTRQLRSTFAPPPEPPPPARRVLSVLVVADPAEDAPLAGAQQEGREVADLFEAFNKVWATSKNRVRVVRLLGPAEATRTAVLRHLMLHTYDVLHFAGHCSYDARRPQSCGWLFSGGERLAVGELTRVDRIPKFVFSNACESGVTSDRPRPPSSGLAPSFAEAFFARGVENFVCTAWPVDDGAARHFALTLYSSLLGLRAEDGEASRWSPVAPRPMHAAMRAARLEVARWPRGHCTWAAYQHYGDPYLRLFDLEAPAAEAHGAEGGAAGADGTAV